MAKTPFVFYTTRTVESVSCPGVILHLRKLTEGRRADLRAKLAPHQRKMKELVDKMGALSDEIDSVDRDAPDALAVIEDKYVQWATMQEEFNVLQDETIAPIWLKWGVKAIEGLVSENDVPLTVDEMREWPYELYEEAFKIVQGSTDISAEAQKNFDSPTTSGGQVAPSQTLSIVPPAEKTDGISTETADGTILN